MNLGLGLYFSRLASKAQGGTLVVEQTAEWPTTFCLRLPTAPGPHQEPRPEGAVAPTSPEMRVNQRS